MLSASIYSQSISGSITDPSDQPVEYSAVALLNYQDSSIYKGVITNEKGAYLFDRIRAGNYVLKVSVVGYEEKYSGMIKVDSLENAELPEIQLSPAKSNDLNEVNITTLQKTVEFKKGNITVNVANSALAMGNTVYDLLVKLPGVAVDDEKISIQGREGVKIMINGRIQQLSPKQIVNLLRSMSASNVEKIEILKNPAVKYDAAGTGGIIHIKTKKTSISGSSGNFSTSGTQGAYPRGESALSLNFKSRKLLIFGDLNAEYGNYTNHFSFNREISYNSVSTSLSEAHVDTEVSSGLQGNAGFDLQISKKSTVGAKVTLSPARDNEHIVGNIEISDQSKGYQRIHYDNSILNTWNYMNYNINAEHAFDTVGTKLSFSADYSPNWDLYVGRFDQRFLNGDQEVSDPKLSRSKNRENVNILSSRLDLEKAMKKDLVVQAGIKGTQQDFKRNYLFETRSVQSGDYFADTSYSNTFDYKETILAGYINFEKELDDLELECGIRAENIEIGGSSPAKHFTLSRKYFNLFPNLSLSYEPSERHSFGFSYNRRINRPDCYSYYPFRSFWTNILLTDLGNPNLLPEYSNTFELTHTFKKVISQAFAYSRIDNYILGYPIQNDSTKEVTVTSRNLKNSNTLGYTLSGEWKIRNWWTLNWNATASYFSYDGQLDGVDYRAGAFSYYAYLSGEVLFKKSNKLEVNAQYFSPVLLGIFSNQPRWSLNLAYKKTFFNEKLSLVLGINDLFYTLIERNRIRFQDQKMDLRETTDSRRFKIALSYDFGKLKVERRETNSNEDEKDRLKH